MKKKVILYGLILAALTIGLKLAEYKFVIRDHAIELYGGIIAALFTVVGIYAGNRLTKKKEVIVERTVFAEKAPLPATEEQLALLGISKREYEVLQLMAEGLSNQ